ncbi:MAG: hypothetical protein NZ811_01990 [Gammaproteobacteria bacterium]|nr:hypothetical protein [Gammaproteobacteria bacterium]
MYIEWTHSGEHIKTVYTEEDTLEDDMKTLKKLLDEHYQLIGYKSWVDFIEKRQQKLIEGSNNDV